jgi:hypothetical protein
MESPVNKLRMVYPVIIQRQTLPNGLARFLEALGLEGCVTLLPLPGVYP